DLARARRHQHDVHHSLPDHLPDLFAILRQRLEADFAIMTLRRQPRRPDAKPHVRILGIGDDEILAAMRVGMNGSQLAIERLLHRVSATCWWNVSSSMVAKQ